ncbi:DEDD exonuclease domain-containing protein [Actinomyces wuliandei]|uniref:DEDD exonuclease domain-containing protein n=1 Tax=Actinomyces wuliandei TaxID=2057743 RepID=UPI000FD7E600
MGTPLREVTFVVVDLETTGAPPGAHALTEIGALKVRGGKVLSRFSTLVNPGAAVPPQITALTGITNAMLVDAPGVGPCLEGFLSWAGLGPDDAGRTCPDAPRSVGTGRSTGTVLVAHNARFDIGHLRGAARALGIGWTEPRVLDTLALARKAWPRGEVANHRLSTLAALVGSPTRPTHRALDDASATADVLHAALEVLAPLGVTHLEDLATATDPVPARRRARSRLAKGLPTTPGVYQLCSATGEVLYVGSTVNLHRRVRSYFTAAERRPRVTRVLDTTAEVRHVPTPTLLEARARELRLIAELDPVANRRSRAPRRQPWLHLVSGPEPHLALTTVLPLHEVGYAVGPFWSRRSAQEALRAAESVLRLRHWDDRAQGNGAGRSTASEPLTGQASDRAVRAASFLSGQADLVATEVLERVRHLAQAQRYEEAGTWTRRLRSLLQAALRAERARPLLTCPHLVAARPREHGGWELVAVRWGMLAGSLVTPRGADPRPGVAALRSSARVVSQPTLVGQQASVEETLLLADWVLEAGARLVEVDGDPQALSWPAASAARYSKVLHADLHPADDRPRHRR